jgi:hypothetical protein
MEVEFTPSRHDTSSCDAIPTVNTMVTSQRIASNSGFPFCVTVLCGQTELFYPQIQSDVVPGKSGEACTHVSTILAMPGDAYKVVIAARCRAPMSYKWMATLKIDGVDVGYTKVWSEGVVIFDGYLAGPGFQRGASTFRSFQFAHEGPEGCVPTAAGTIELTFYRCQMTESTSITPSSLTSSIPPTALRMMRNAAAHGLSDPSRGHSVLAGHSVHSVHSIHTRAGDAQERHGSFVTGVHRRVGRPIFHRRIYYR